MTGSDDRIRTDGEQPKPIALQPLGADDAVACEGDACVIPAPSATPGGVDERDD